MGYKMKGGVAPPIKTNDIINESELGVFDDLDLSSIEPVENIHLDMSTDNTSVLNDSVDMGDISAIEQNDSDVVNLDDATFEETPEEESVSINDTTTSFSGGKKRTRKYIRKHKGKYTKKYRAKKTRKGRKKRKTISRYSKHNRSSRKKIRGGTNVGCNTNDPNFNIYNTQMLKLFPYKP